MRHNWFEQFALVPNFFRPASTKLVFYTDEFRHAWVRVNGTSLWLFSRRLSLGLQCSCGHLTIPSDAGAAAAQPVARNFSFGIGRENLGDSIRSDK